MRLLDFIYLTRTRAQALGFTHEGYLFGVPAWLADVDSDAPLACPKVVPLQFYAIACDWLVEAMTWCMPEDSEIRLPIRATAPIAQVKA